jgi:radical SAM/Cys-rich protein
VRSKTDKSIQSSAIQPFSERLAANQLALTREQTTTLQINTGLLCDLCCRHCHLSAGPQRNEVLNRSTMEQIIAHARQVHYQTIDITGGAPELVPDLHYLIEQLAPLTKRLMLRTNLTALNRPDKHGLIDLFKQHNVVLVASFPATNPGQLEAQRGSGVMASSLHMLKQLNAAGYGMPGSGLQLDLAASPSGAFLPSGQDQAEKKFKRDLARKWGLEFNQLYIFANMPLGRFLQWLQQSDNLASYMEKLSAGFNPCAVAGLMCRSLLSVNWDGYLYDCDFNLAVEVPLSGKATHISELSDYPIKGMAIAVGEHCYACTAGAGFT